MALTKITGQVVDTTTDLVVGVTTVGGGVSAVDGFFSGIITATGPVSISTNLTVGGSLSVGGTITYEDVTNVDAVGLITARDGIKVGSGITLSVDGHGFYTGIITATFAGDGSSLTGVANTDVIFTDKLSVGDLPARINIGVGSDVQIYHDGDNTTFLNQTGVMTLKNTGSGKLQLMTQGSQDVEIKTNNELSIKCNDDGAVELYHDASKKLETASGGVTVTGTVAATSYTGDGSSLTGISVGIATTASQVSGITTVIDLDKDDIRLDATGLVTIDTKGGTEGGNHTLRIVNSGIATVSFSSYFKFPSGAPTPLPTASGAISLVSFTVHTQGRVGVASVFLTGSSINYS